MNIKTHLSKASSRKIWDEVVGYVGDDKARFEELISLFFGKDIRLIQRVSQPIGIISEKYPQLIAPYLERLVTNLESNPIDAVKRNTMRIFQYNEIPEEIEGRLFEIGMNYLKSAEEAIAIKAFSMTVLRKICEKYPELTQEVIFILEILLKEKISGGITSRGKKELKKLNKIKNAL